MSISVYRCENRWWVLKADGVTAVDSPAVSTGELLADRAAISAAVAGPSQPPPAAVMQSPVTSPCRVVAQMTNYRTHLREAGMNPKTVPLAFFRKTSHSISGPEDDIVRPAEVRFLDYEIEIGLVLGKDLPVGAAVDETNLAEYVGALVITNDVSARDLQLPKTQFYEGKSAPTFTPVGPLLVILEDGDWNRFDDLRLRLWVNGELRQDSYVGPDMLFKPAQALGRLSTFQPLSAGDLVLTGTPGGTALKAPFKVVELIGALLPPAVKWKVFFRSQGRNELYLADGDKVELNVATDDGVLDLGRQETIVRGAR